ncbi:hypothetical protein SLS62_003442 [Diatrype stigma]|uniref:Uncharacterized protein n=1 Tax=Diatrype stigma TaxID=117547 RepID=A0AAN9V6Y7_9PEZI
MSGNMTQSGNLVFMALLIITAGLLGLSNAHARTLRMHGRIAAPTTDRLPYHHDHPGPHPHQPPSASSLSPPYATSSPPLSGSGDGEKGSPAAVDPCASSVDLGSSPYPDSGSWGVDSSSTWPPATTATATMTRNSTGFSGLEDREEV